jgi:hypothetical protein
MRLIAMKKHWFLVAGGAMALVVGGAGIFASATIAKRRAICHSVGALALPALDRTIARLASEARASGQIAIASGGTEAQIR